MMMRKCLPWITTFWILCLAFTPGLARAQEEQAKKLPKEAHVEGIVGYAQTYNLTCESRSAVDWAAFWGVSINEWEFLSALPRTDNPNTGFVGDYNGAWGSIPPYAYGVHARPVAAVLRQHGLRAKAQINLTWKELKTEIASGRPVIIWVIGPMWRGDPIEYQASSGKRMTVAPYEHTMIATGYDSNNIYAIDASSGARQAYDISTFLSSWSVLGNMAVTGQEPERLPTPTSSPAAKTRSRSVTYTERGTYSVQPGDYLIALAARFSLDWQELARLNAIPYPYTLHPGQVLIFPGSTFGYSVYMPMMQRKPPKTVSP